MKRCIFSFFLMVSGLLSVFAQGVVWNQRFQDYFDTYKDVAIDQMHQYKIPASITLAQGVLESGAGRSELALKANNHFGIKCNGWTGRTAYHDDDERNECFRAYNSVFESYKDHSVFLTSSQRYSRLFQLKITDYKGWAKGLKACGYATSPVYATKLIDIIEVYKLYQYDTAKESGKSRHEMDISYRKLARYNERDKNDVLEEGEVVWLQKKARKAPKSYKGKLHRVEAGESMYTIAQKYGIRMKNLYKMNDLPPTYQIRVGDLLRLR